MRPASVRASTQGFSLVELAVVLTIVTIMLSMTIYTYSAQVENRNITDTQRRLEDAKEMLIGFAILNGRLPCPASTTSNGDESPSGGGICTDGYSGYLPARAMGFSPQDASGYGLDAWGNRIRYAVSMNPSVGTNTFTTTPSGSNGIRNNFGTSTALVPKDLLLCPSSEASGMSTSTSAPSCGTIGGQSLAVTNTNTVVAVVWSPGKNYTTASYSGVSGQAGPDEAYNNKVTSPANSVNGVFIYRQARSALESNPYDDQIVWLSVNLLYARMVAAGQLP
jgi:prepilin-type N-terminal cleavage/methylation domain-containing protein